MTPHHILVTGGAGFIGSHTVDLLLSKGKQVTVLDNLSTGKLTNLNLRHPDLEFIEGDVLEYPLLESLVQDCDAVLHLAAIVSVPKSIEDPIYSFQVNTQGFLHVLRAIQQAKQAKRLVYASSAAVYGDASELPCRDDVSLKGEPLSPYALQKMNAEDYARLYARLHGVASLSLRYFNVYGQRQDPSSPYSGVVSKLLNAYQCDTEFTLFGDGLQSRDFIAVSDVAAANVLALHSSHEGVLNIATGKPQTLLQLIEYLKAAGKKPLKLQFAPARAGDIKASYAATQLAEAQLGFKASVSLEQGLQQLWQDGCVLG